MPHDNVTLPGKLAAQSPASNVDLLADRPFLGAQDVPTLCVRPAPRREPTQPTWLEYFRLDRILGEGGMGTVYLAEDTRLGRKVAIKTMRREFVQKPGAKERFLREGRSVAKLEDDHIVPVYHVGEDNGIPFLVMPYLQGEALSTRLINEGCLPADQAMRIAREIALGLAAAHAKGLIHRDIKPGNIWLESPNGRVKILDFGLARSCEDEAPLTATGFVVGTPAYMSPEQARGLVLDSRSDLFSLGCVLYQMLIGQPPFTGSDTMAILTSLAVDTPKSPREAGAACPQALSDLTMRLLSRSPERRPFSAREVTETLASIDPDADQTAVQHAFQLRSRGQDEATHQETPLPATRRPTLRRVAWLAVPLLAALPVAAWLAGTTFRTEIKADTPIVEAGDIQSEDKPRVITPPPEVPKDADRKAATWALSVGGSVHVNDQGAEVRAVGELPGGALRLTSAYFDGEAKVDDIGLANVRGCKNLTVFGVNTAAVTDAGLANLAGSTRLTNLTLTNSKVSDEGLATFKDCKGLTTLCLNHTQVGDAGLAHLRGCADLAILNLYDTKVSDAGLANFAECKKLVHVFLDSTGVGDTGLAHLAGCKGLQILSLSNTKLTNAGLAHFAHCENLAHLNLIDTKLTDQGLAHLASCKNLTHLHLENTAVTDASAAVLRGFTRLVRLNLKGTKITADTLRELGKALPGCHIEP